MSKATVHAIAVLLVASLFCSSYLASVQAQEAGSLPKLPAPPKDHWLNIPDTNLPKLWGSVMGVLGPYDKTQKCWILKAESRFFCLRPAKYARAEVKDSTKHMFAITGIELERDRKGFTNALKGAPDGGAVVFLSLDQSTTNPAKSLKLTTIDGIYELGSIGYPPSDDDFALVSLGGDIYAWAVTSHGNGAGGEMASSTNLIVATGIPNLKGRNILSFLSARNNSGGCGSEMRIVCTEEHVRFRIVPSAKTPRNIELTYDETVGNEQTFIIFNTSTRNTAPPLTIRFEESKSGYPIPVKHGATIMEWFSALRTRSYSNPNR